MAKHREDAQPFSLATFGKVGHLRGSACVNDEKKRYRQAQTQRPIRAALLAPAQGSHSTFAIVAVIAAGCAQNQVRHLAA